MTVRDHFRRKPDNPNERRLCQGTGRCWLQRPTIKPMTEERRIRRVPAEREPQWTNLTKSETPTVSRKPNPEGKKPSPSLSRTQPGQEPSSTGLTATSPPLPTQSYETPSKPLCDGEAPSATRKCPTDPCARCQHPRSDHEPSTERRHTHFRTAPGDQSAHLFATTCHDPYCHAALCGCMMFQEIGDVLVSSFAPWYLIQEGLWKSLNP